VASKSVSLHNLKGEGGALSDARPDMRLRSEGRGSKDYGQRQQTSAMRDKLGHSAEDLNMRPPVVGRCKLKRVETRVESAWFRRLKLRYDAPL